MEITASSISDVVVLKLDGELKSRNDIAGAFWEHFNRGSSKFILNFEKVAMVNSAGLQALIELQRLAETAGGGLYITGINSNIQRVFQASRMDEVLKIYKDEDMALVGLLGGLPHDVRITPMSRYQN
jgi:anti-anti-sigma factor